MLVVVLLVAALGVTGSLFGYRQAHEAQRIGMMLEQLHRLHAAIHETLREGMNSATTLDPQGRERLERHTAAIESSLATLVAKAVSLVEIQVVASLGEHVSTMRADLVRLFSGSASERERQRLVMLAPDYGRATIDVFDREVVVLTDSLALAAAMQRARLLRTTHLAAWLSPLLALLAIALVWATRGSVRRQLDAPVRRLLDGVERVGSGDLNHRVPPDGATELAALADGLNRMARELTRQQQALLVRERDAALGQLVPVVAHNIRNPLASIRAASQLLDGASAEECKRLGCDIIATVDRLERWIRALLNYLNPAQPNLSARPLRRLLDEALEATRYRFDSKQVTCRIDDQLPDLVVSADADLVEQALHGLLVNAVEASPAGSTIGLTIDADARGPRLEIVDQGPGMSFTPLPDDLRPGPSSKRTGTGLGIPFAYKICAAHGWRLEFDSAPGAGARITVRLHAANE